MKAAGQLVAAIEAAKATKLQAVAQYQTTVSDTLLAVRLAYYDALLAVQEIIVHEASVKLLQKELEDQQHRLNAGTVPKFNVLRAEVAVANERPNLIRAQNQYRITKNNLSNLLGYNLPRDIWENIPLNLTDTLEAKPYEINLPDAIQQALSRRTRLVGLAQDRWNCGSSTSSMPSPVTSPRSNCSPAMTWVQFAVFATGTLGPMSSMAGTPVRR